jgi:hypothetical protein
MSVTVKLHIADLEAALAKTSDPTKKARLQARLDAARRTERALAGAPDDDADDDVPAPEAAPNDAEAARHARLLRDPFDGDRAAEARAVAGVLERAMRAPGTATVSMGPGRAPLTIQLDDRVPPAARASIRRAVSR